MKTGLEAGKGASMKDGPLNPGNLASDLAAIAAFRGEYLGWLGSRILGREATLERLLVAFLCEGNVLLEGPPGLGKTSLAKAWSEFLGLGFRRIQFTPDLMPLDIIGSTMIARDAEGARSLRFVPGPLFTNVVLGDEINRATPKTQSAFLEAMEEKCVTFLGETRSLPSPFFVIATQNPIELEGTYPLPEAQIDRFLMKLFFDMPDFLTLRSILDSRDRERRGSPAGREASLSILETFRRASKEIVVADDLRNFIVRLVIETHPDKSSVEAVKKYVRFGASPRCALGLLAAAKAKAALDGRVAASFEDVSLLFPDIANHRVLLEFEAESDGVAVAAILEAVLSAVRKDYLGTA
ncbi:MAG TPA: MoxR family ATPase [Rectinemataceae bacterium]|nr:MoxR family ATPase [Rectinemataceae bacterium]